MGFLHESDFVGDFEDSKSTSGDISYILLDVQEANVGVPQFYRIKNYFVGYWEVSRSSNSAKNINKSWSRTLFAESQIHSKQKGNRDVFFSRESQLYIFEVNEAKINMIIKGRNPTLRHVSRTHRVALDWLFDRINLDPKIQIKFIHTKETNRRHVNQKETSHVMSGTDLRLVEHYEFLDVSLQPFLFQRESRVSCPEKLRKVLLKKVRQWRNRDQRIWVSRNLASVKKDPPEDLDDSNSPGNQKLDQSCVSSSGKKLTRNIN